MRTRTPAAIRAELAEIEAIFAHFSISGKKLKAGVPLPQVVREWVEATESGAKDMGYAITAGLENEQRLEAALKPFADFADAFDAMPIKGLSPDEVYSIHGGEYCKPHGATIGWPHLRAAQAAIKAAKE
jgi:hypothetical protein